MRTAGRYDLIALKLYAAADSDPSSVHFQDLLALEPTAAELNRARDWLTSQDVSEAFAQILDQVIENATGSH